MAVLVWLASRSHRTPWVPAIRTGNLTGRSRPAGAQWARFLRNHDEIDLSRLTADQRADVFAALGPEPEMQLYGPGIRRRLAPMLGGDRRWTWLACSLQFTLRGPPVLRYGGRESSASATTWRCPVATPSVPPCSSQPLRAAGSPPHLSRIDSWSTMDSPGTKRST
jgi:hypothetical protein